MRRVHLLSTPNVQATAAYYLDVFSGFTRRFAELLTELGYEVFLYASEEADVPCSQLVTCISKADQAKFLGDEPYHKAWYDGSNPMFVHFNVRAAAGIQARKEPGDMIATIAGTAQAAVWQQHSDLRFLEYSIGYRGVVAPYRVYQSHAWRHVAHGFTGCEYGRTTDDVIYHWFHEDDFPTRPVEPYVLYVGRIVSVKGLKTACRAAEAAGVKLFLIGDGDPSLITYGEYLGHMPPSERNRWMAGATALLCPTEYIEPSACVATEAQLCGTPVISTPWGGFTEYVEHGQTGFWCKSPQEFIDAIGKVSELDRDYVRARARTLYGWEAGKTAYRDYFARLDTLSDGWPVKASALALQE